MPMSRRVGIIGGGTAGYLTALALRRLVPSIEVTLIESTKIPIIGVGEATTPPLLSFLHAVLGIDVHELQREVAPTWKLGIRFLWGSRGGFHYPFSPGELTEARLFDGHIETASLPSMLMSALRTPMVRAGDQVRSALPQVRFAYHLDNQRFVRFLSRKARELGVRHLDATVDHVDVGTGSDGEPRVESLVLDDGTRLSFDLYVDCSGFRSVLVEQAMQSRYVSYADTLYCDRAVVADVPHDGFVKPYTTAESMNFGWCWNIPMFDCDHRGYVYSSSWCSDDEAVAEMRSCNPRMGEHRFVRFRSGRHEHFWRGNVVGVGNAYAFVEPLESTALHMVVIHALRLVRLLDPASKEEDRDRDTLNRRVGAHWDYLRWFLGLHYRFNRQRGNAFWRTCQETVDISGLEDVVDDFRVNGPLSSRSVPRPPDAIFGASGIDVMLLGQDVACAPGRARMTEPQWRERSRERARFVTDALSHQQARQALDANPRFLDELVASELSWCPRLAYDMLA